MVTASGATDGFAFSPYDAAMHGSDIVWVRTGSEGLWVTVFTSQRDRGSIRPCVFAFSTTFTRENRTAAL
jgi:hypothetical protein